METGIDGNEAGVQFRHFQSRLLPFAYNITGDFMAAEDIVQDVLNHHFLNSNEHIDNINHYLVRSVINKSINHKKLLRSRMEEYRSKWLPSPVMTEDNIYAGADRSRILHYSLLVLMEQLSPKERAVFILKETFDFNHEEIAEVLNITPEHSRQLLKRGKKKIMPQGGEYKKGLTEKMNDGGKQLLHQLVDAISSADIEKTKSLLAHDVQSISDGGPHMRAAQKVLVGPDSVSKFLKAIYGKYLPEGATTTFTIINHVPAIVFRHKGQVFRCIMFEMEKGVIQKIFIVVNPEKFLGVSRSD